MWSTANTILENPLNSFLHSVSKDESFEREKKGHEVETTFNSKTASVMSYET